MRLFTDSLGTYTVAFLPYLEGCQSKLAKFPIPSKLCPILCLLEKIAFSLADLSF
jgi:hypothetical protein